MNSFKKVLKWIKEKIFGKKYVKFKIVGEEYSQEIEIEKDIFEILVNNAFKRGICIEDLINEIVKEEEDYEILNS